MPQLLQKLMGAGVSAGLAVAMGDDLEDSATAAGTTQTDAKKIYTATVRFTTVASGAGAVLPDGVRGDSVLVVNDGANDLSLYPPSGHAIDNLATNAAMTVPAGEAIWLDRVTRLGWRSGSISAANVRFAQSGSGPIATTVSDRIGLEANLWDFLSASERADMGTASLDVSTAVATAIGWFGSNGGTLIVPGYFGLGAAGISLASKTGIVIEGRGPKAGFKALAVSATSVATWGESWIRLTSGTRCGLRNLYLDGNDFDHNIVACYQGTECFFERNTLVNGGGFASIFAGGNTRNRYLDNVIKDSDGFAESRGMWIGNIQTLEVETDCVIRGNFVTNTGGSGISGVQVGGVTTGNVVTDCGGSGIVVASDVSVVYSKGVTISGNVCKRNAFQGIQIGDPAAAGDYVENIVASNNVCEGNANNGIFIKECRDSAVTGNVCRDNNTVEGTNNSGIAVLIAKRVSISGNVCVDTRAGSSRTQQHGIVLLASAAALDIEDINVSGNTCRNNELHGIAAINSGSGTIDTISITGNVCTDNGTDGIRVADVADGNIAPVTCVGNTCIGNGGVDIRLDPTNCVIGPNKFSTNTTYILNFTDGDTTPSVAGRNVFRTVNTGATTITDFDDGVDGQEITVIFSDANTTVSDAGNLALSAAFTSTANDTLTLIRRGTVWFEKCRSAN